MSAELQIIKIRNREGKVAALVAQEEMRATLAGVAVTDEMREAMKRFYEERERLLGGKKLEDTSNNVASAMAGAFNVQFFDPMSARFNEFADVARSALSSVSSSMQSMFGQWVSGWAGKGLQSILPASLFPSARGNVFRGGMPVQAFATGGVVTGPTVFPMARGAGLMGEAGPEAVMPLRRGRGGRLGVEASGGGGSTTVVNYSPTVNAQDASGVDRVLREDKARLMRLLGSDGDVRRAVKGMR